MKKYTRGFTLIELLVVIAIIGILSSVVLVSLNSARSKGKDARVIASVQQVRTLLEAGYNGSAYVDLVTNANCFSATAITANNATNANCTNATGPNFAAMSQLVTDANTQGGNLYFVANNGNGAYAIRGRLVSSPTTFFCIDSTGKTNPSDTNVVAGANCN